MKRILLSTLLLLTACRVFTPSPTLTPTLPPTHTPTPIVATPTTFPTLSPYPSAISSPALTPNAAAPLDFLLRAHPDGGLYVGDRVSLEVISSEASDLQGQSLHVDVEEAGGELGLETQFAPYGIAGRMQANLLWSWNTSGLSPGNYQLEFSIPSREMSWSETLTLLPASEVPPPEPEAAWSHTETDCCLVYYITGTAVERDLADLLNIVEAQADDAVRQMGVELDKPVLVTLLPRVLGHGGFSGSEISVSYLDRNYAGNNVSIVLHHEIVHALDSRLEGDLRPSLLIEGLAVYLAGGHFKPEPLSPRAAGLLPPQPDCSPAADFISGKVTGSETGVCSLGWYLPLVPLLDDFYNSQHEVGYLQAASLIEFMVNTWGWDAFDAFYRDIHIQPEPEDPSQDQLRPQARAVNSALVSHFGITVQQLESSYLASLEQEILLPELVEDVRQSVGYYDTVRRYQQIMDPSAYFLTAWLPDGEAMRTQGIVADYLRRPSSPENITLETMLVAADADLQMGDFIADAELLAAINAVLDAMQVKNPQPFASHDLASQYFSIVNLLLAQGYQPQQITLEKETAQALVTTTGPELLNIALELQSSGWAIMESTQTPVPP